MDMQNVSNLQIPEGVVRTIHDKNSRLIWGRLAYDTKYTGDIYQQTYSGKNLWDFNGLPNKSYLGANLTINEVFDSGTIVTGNTSTSAVDSAYSKGWFSPALSPDNTSKRIPLNEGDTFTISADVTILETGYSNTIYIGRYLGTVNQGFGQGNTLTVGVKTRISETFTASASGDYSPYITLSSCKVRIENLQFEKGSATAYEPYTGGIPAPNPDYPQPIQVVTGAQTVTISDGVDSEDFTINLGSIELCKIGDYQDYIYKSGDDWYVHKELNKVVFNGTGVVWSASTDGDGFYRLDTTLSDVDNVGPQRTTSGIISDHFIASGTSAYGIMFRFNTRIYFYPESNIHSTVEWNTWLASNNVTLYYDLATPTDTQITDATLVGQLNAVHEWLTRYGYNSTVTGDLPLIVDRTNL